MRPLGEGGLPHSPNSTAPVQLTGSAPFTQAGLPRVPFPPPWSVYCRGSPTPSPPSSQGEEEEEEEEMSDGSGDDSSAANVSTPGNSVAAGNPFTPSFDDPPNASTNSNSSNAVPYNAPRPSAHPTTTPTPTSTPTTTHLGTPTFSFTKPNPLFSNFNNKPEGCEEEHDLEMELFGTSSVGSPASRVSRKSRKPGDLRLHDSATRKREGEDTPSESSFSMSANARSPRFFNGLTPTNKKAQPTRSPAKWRQRNTTFDFCDPNGDSTRTPKSSELNVSFSLSVEYPSDYKTPRPLPGRHLSTNLCDECVATCNRAELQNLLLCKDLPDHWYEKLYIAAHNHAPDAQIADLTKHILLDNRVPVSLNADILKVIDVKPKDNCEADDISEGIDEVGGLGLHGISLIVFKKTSPVRVFAATVTQHPHVEHVLTFLIIFNTISLMALDPSEVRGDSDRSLTTSLFLYVDVGSIGIFVIDYALKVIAWGLIRGETTLFGQPHGRWYFLDCAVLAISIGFLMTDSPSVGMIRSFRVVKPLRKLSIGFRTILDSLMKSVAILRDSVFLLLFSLALWGFIGFDLFGGTLNERCVHCEDVNCTTYQEAVPPYYCFREKLCPGDMVCTRLEYIFPYKFSNFDNIGSSMLAIFQITTFASWADMMLVYARVVSPSISFFYFISIVCFIAWVVLNLFVAVIHTVFSTIRSNGQRSGFGNSDDFSLVKRIWDKVYGVFLFLLRKTETQVLTSVNPGHAQRSSGAFLEDVGVRHNRMTRIVNSACFEITINVLLLANLVVQCTRYRGMSEEHETFLQVSEHVFAAVFALEVAIKIAALRSLALFLEEKWNVFDLVLVVTSVLSLYVWDTNVAFLRSLRAFRTAKLLHSNSALRGLVENSFDALAPALNVLLFFVFGMLIFAGVGKQLLGGTRPETMKQLTRHNFDTIGDALVTLFVVLTSDNWFVSLYLFMQKDAPFVAVFFYVVFYIWSVWIMLSLFTAVVLEAFDVPDEDKRARLQKMKLALSECITASHTTPEVFTMAKVKKSLRGITSVFDSEAGPFSDELDELDTSDSKEKGAYPQGIKDIKEASTSLLATCSSSNFSTAELHNSSLPTISTPTSLSKSETKDLFNNSTGSPCLSSDSQKGEQSACDSHGHRGILKKSGQDSGYDVPLSCTQSRKVSFFGDIKQCGLDLMTEDSGAIFVPSYVSSVHAVDMTEDDGEVQNINNFIDPKTFSVLWEKDCRAPALDSGPRLAGSAVHLARNSRKWRHHFALYLLPPNSRLRLFCHCVTNHVYFEAFICTVIMLSCVVTVYDLYAFPPSAYKEDSRGEKQRILVGLDWTIAAVFLIEFLLKVTASGFVLGETAYLKDPWNRFDFLLLALMFGLANEFKTARAFRPLRFVRRIKRVQNIMAALWKSIPMLVTLSLATCYVVLLFALIGTELYLGRLDTCNAIFLSKEQCVGNIVIHQELVWDDVDSFAELTPSSDLLTGGYLVPLRWEKPVLHFDDMLSSSFTLLQVMSLSSWSDLMYATVDATSEDHAPQRNAQPAHVLFFIVFIVIGTFFLVNIFIGVIVMSISVEENVDLLTDDQRNWRELRSELLKVRRPLHKAAPQNKVRSAIFRVVNSFKFSVFIGVVLLVYVLIGIVSHVGQPQWFTDASGVADYVIMSVFALEALAKIVAYGPTVYFYSHWNKYDFVLASGNVTFTMMELVMESAGGWIAFLGVIFRIGRLIRLVKRTKGVRFLIETLLSSADSIFHALMIFSFLLFTWAISGVHLFGNVKFQTHINSQTNFRTFGNALLLLFKLVTLDGWNDTMWDCAIQPPFCTRNDVFDDCGPPIWAARYVTFLLNLRWFAMSNNAVQRYRMD